MGLRDVLKARVKAVLGRGDSAPGSGPRPPAATAPGSGPRSPAATAPAATATTATATTATAEPTAPVGPTAPTAWARMGPASRITESQPGTFAHDGATVAVFRKGGALYAIDNACAHEDGPLGEGSVRGSVVTCPYHDWQYDFTTGACLTDPDRARATWSVREAEGAIWLGARLTAGSDSRGGEHDDGMEVIRR
jgi:nitrite reductase/ring-hydroxylating ferredoxin subunit